MSNITVNVYSSVVLYYWIHNWQMLKIEKIISIWLVCSKNTWKHTYWAINEFISFVCLSLLIIKRIVEVLTHSSLIPALHIEHVFHYTPCPISTHVKNSKDKKALCIFHFKIKHFKIFQNLFLPKPNSNFKKNTNIWIFYLISINLLIKLCIR